tara:strand:+ start:34 stop:252 length:219 start_codon:yes stop_codon:yes gene_type:complete
MATPKNVWNNSAEMHKLISKEPDSYFDSPKPTKVISGTKTYFEYKPSQFAIDAILNEARINRLNGGSKNVSF